LLCIDCVTARTPCGHNDADLTARRASWLDDAGVEQPKYVAIAESLRARCQSLPTGTRLPPERQLAAEFGVSPMTVRQALASLMESGWVIRRRGSGTYVGRPTVSMGPTLTSFTQDMARRGLTSWSRVLRNEQVDVDVVTAGRLSLPPHQRVTCIERLRFADDEPMCHEVSLFPSWVARLLHDDDLVGSVHLALSRQGVVPHSTERRVRAAAADHHEATLLDLPVGSPVLAITDLFVDTQRRPMQLVRTTYRFDRYEVVSYLEAR
jgi:GntR family transcriptional regulator